ncbi:oxidoreductase [Kytococcus sedentarius]|uniref:oxidoreductase n=1 Tax=Kytococcus sedentarius TaxID=1276 RepID=UPI0035BC7AFB
MMKHTALALLASAALVGAPTATAAPPGPDLTWRTSVTDSDQNLRGLAAVSATEAWVSGESRSGGAAGVFHTTDGGRTWQDVTPSGTEGLSLRDVEVVGDAVHVLAIGPGEDSRILRSTDDGRTWTETFRNAEEAAFYNCMAFFPDGRRGLAVSDPVDGRIRLAATNDAGRTWEVLPDDGMVPTEGEAQFSASGDCLTISGSRAHIVTGGERSRVLTSSDRGLTWTAADSGLRAGEAAGAFAASFTGRHGIVVGGDFADATNTRESTARSHAGRAWQTGQDLTHVGEDVAHVRGSRVALATGDYGGSEGTSLTRDGGASWERVDDQGFHALECTHGGTCWGAGSDGVVGTLDG